MANITLLVKAEPGVRPIGIAMAVERVPVTGDYIAPVANQLVRVKAVVLTPSGPTAAAVFAVHDPDDLVDEAV